MSTSAASPAEETRSPPPATRSPPSGHTFSPPLATRSPLFSRGRSRNERLPFITDGNVGISSSHLKSCDVDGAHEDDMEIRGEVPLRAVTQISLDKLSPSPMRRRTVQVHLGGGNDDLATPRHTGERRTYELRARSESDALRWVEELQSGVEAARSGMDILHDTNSGKIVATDALGGDRRPLGLRPGEGYSVEHEDTASNNNDETASDTPQTRKPSDNILRHVLSAPSLPSDYLTALEDLMSKGVSAFEFLNSGIVPHLNRCFAPRALTRPGMGERFSLRRPTTMRARTRNWTHDYQELLDRPTPTAEAARERAHGINTLARGMTEVVLPIVKQLVDDMARPGKERRIAPRGIENDRESGHKYIHEGLFFKFGVDGSGLYHGDMFAMKALSHEHKGLQAIVEARVPHITVPLTTLVTYHGHRVLASSLLPVSPETLVYGSSDGGATFVESDPMAASLVRTVCERLNLKAHNVGRGERRRVVYGPVDLGGHVGRDGRFYLVNAGRLFPPTPPAPNSNGNTHLFQLLRPEFISRYPYPLSSDAFSTFGREDKTHNNAEVRKAFEIMLQEGTAAATAALMKSAVEEAAEGDSVLPLSAILHQCGVNVRYMAHVYNALPEDETGTPVRRRLVAEMAARVCKDAVWREWRELAAATPTVNDAEFVAIAQVHFDNLLGEGEVSDSYWLEVILPGLGQKFMWEGVESSAELRAKVLDQYLRERFLHLVGLEMDAEEQKIIRTVPCVKIATSVTHTKELEMLVESMHQQLEKKEAALGQDSPYLVGLLCNMAEVSTWLSRLAEAEELLRRALAIRELQSGTDDVGLVDDLSRLASHLESSMGRFEEAETHLQRALTIAETRLGPDHPDLRIDLTNLANLYTNIGRYEEAERLYRRALKLAEDKIGRMHPDVVIHLTNLAILFEKTGRHKKAEPLYCRALKIDEDHLGMDHQDVCIDLNNLAGLYESLGRYKEAEPLYERALAIDREKLGPDHPDVAIDLNNLANLYVMQERFAEAEPLYVQALRITQEKLGDNNPDVSIRLNNLAHLYVHQSRYAEAEPLFERALQIDENKFGPDHEEVAIRLLSLASFYSKQGMFTKAEPLYLRSLRIVTEKLGPDHHYTSMIKKGLTKMQKRAARRAASPPPPLI